MTEFLNQYGTLLAQGTLETLYMTGFATLFAYVLGLPMGVLLTVTKEGSIAAAPRFHAAFGWIVNLLRSLPFIILMFFIIPLTRLIAGTSIGATAALVPLTLSAAPFVARMVEQSLEEVDGGVRDDLNVNRQPEQATATQYDLRDVLGEAPEVTAAPAPAPEEGEPNE